MKYLVTKKQVEEMYYEAVNKAINGKSEYDLVIYKDKDKMTRWVFDEKYAKGDILYKVENADKNLFEWVLLKEIGGRRKYSKKDLIDGIQWNITKNYEKEI